MVRSRSGFDLVLISALVLFLELACIRWFPAHVMFLSFFTNTVLLASFIGMSIGCLMARRPTNHIAYTPYLLLLALAGGLICDSSPGFMYQWTNVGNQNKPEIVYFGLDNQVRDDLIVRVPIEAIAGLFFLLVAATHIGPGQELGRAFNRIPNRTHSYAANLLGSLGGIALFAICSHFQSPPLVWFSIVAIGLGYSISKLPTGTSKLILRFAPVALVLLLLMTVPTSFSTLMKGNNKQTRWSPYYRIDYEPTNGVINTNLTGHQTIIPLDNSAYFIYHMPHVLRQEMKDTWPEFKRVLVIGAGSGNDLSRALYWCPKDAIIDAVEIDPVIQDLGIKNHPNKPYDDARIVRHLNDGRNFLRKAETGTYDVVIFALVDSLVLHSGYSSIRLESFLFSADSFADVKRVLKPTGVAAVYNYFRNGWIVARLREVLRDKFDFDPVVMCDPPQASVPLEETMDNGGNAILIGGSKEMIAPLREKFRRGEKLWMPVLNALDRDNPGKFSAVDPNAADPTKATERWAGFVETQLEESNGDLKTANDDWPFLYVRRPGIPGLTWRGVLLTLGLSALLWFAYHRYSRRETDPDPITAHANSELGLYLRAFFLGAGFMLIETKAVVQMALLFGSTWSVNTYVFAAILVMAVLGNFYTGLAKPKRLEPYYIGLFVAMGVGLIVPLETFLGLNPIVQVVASCALVFAPVLFAGVIFPSTFSRVQRPDWFFAANVAGALVGGLAENASMLLGFRYLLLVACGFYAISACFGNRRDEAAPMATPQT